MAKHTSNAESKLLSQIRKPDLSVLGGAIKTLPRVQWQERMFFAGVDDVDLSEWSGGFPATFRKELQTHPVFVLRCHHSGHLLCPCSSSGNKTFRYIKTGCRFEMKKNVSDRNSYLVERFKFTLPLDSRFRRKPIFLGRVPESCIIG